MSFPACTVYSGLRESEGEDKEVLTQLTEELGGRKWAAQEDSEARTRLVQVEREDPEAKEKESEEGAMQGAGWGSAITKECLGELLRGTKENTLCSLHMRASKWWRW